MPGKRITFDRKAFIHAIELITKDAGFRDRLEEQPLKTLDEIGIKLAPDKRGALEGKTLSQITGGINFRDRRMISILPAVEVWVEVATDPWVDAAVEVVVEVAVDVVVGAETPEKRKEAADKVGDVIKSINALDSVRSRHGEKK